MRVALHLLHLHLLHLLHVLHLLMLHLLLHLHVLHLLHVLQLGVERAGWTLKVLRVSQVRRWARRLLKGLLVLRVVRMRRPCWKRPQALWMLRLQLDMRVRRRRHGLQVRRHRWPRLRLRLWRGTLRLKRLRRLWRRPRLLRRRRRHLGVSLRRGRGPVHLWDGLNVREEGLQRSLGTLLCLLRCRGERWDLRPRQTRPAVCRAGRGVRGVRGEV